MVWTPGKPVALTTEHFLIRSLRPEDVSERYAGWWSDREVMASISRPERAETLDEHRQRIAKRYDNRKNFHVGIFDRENDLIIGFISVLLNTFHGTANVNFVIGDRDYWGKNLVRELSGTGLEFIFEQLRAEKITGKIMARNYPTVYLAKAIGLSVEGILKKEWRLRDKSRADVLVVGLLRDDWRKQRQGKKA